MGSYRKYYDEEVDDTTDELIVDSMDEFEDEFEDESHSELQNEVVPEKSKKKSTGSGPLILMFLLLICAMSLVFFQYHFFKLTKIDVIGAKRRDPQVLASNCALPSGTNLFRINEKKVTERLEKDYYIMVNGFYYDFMNGTLSIYITERQPVACVESYGMNYLIDENGVILPNEIDIDISEFPRIKGLHARSQTPGIPLRVSNQQQFNAYQEIIDILYELNYNSKISKIDLSKNNEISLETYAGITIKMGSIDNVRAKLIAAMTNISFLRQLNINTGFLDVSIPERGKFSPSI